MLALLACAARQVLARDKLIGLLWPEASTSTARQLLNVSVHEIRKALGDAVLLSEGETLRLDATRIRVDTLEFESALAHGNPERAAELAIGPFLDGFALPDAVAFEQWAESERDRWERRHQASLEQIAERSAVAGDLTQAVHWWRERLARTPTDARIVLRLMDALDNAGDRAGAVKLAEMHALLLQREFGGGPDVDVASFATLLRRGRQPADSPRPDAVRPEDAQGTRYATNTELLRVSPGEDSTTAPINRSTRATPVIVPFESTSQTAFPAASAEEGRTVPSKGKGRDHTFQTSLYVAAFFTVLGSAVVWWWTRDGDAVPVHISSSVLTALQGVETDPDVSPSGDRVVFAWDEGREQKRHLFLISSNGGDPVRLTEGDGEDGFPTWSPDASNIAFLRSYEGGRFISPAPTGCCRTDLMVVSTLGRPVRRITSSSWAQGLDWSPDGEWLAFADRIRPDSPLRIFLVSVKTGQKDQLTVDPANGQVVHDTDPVFSADGKHIAFVRRLPDSGGRGSVYLQAVKRGESAQRLTGEDWAWDIDWTPNQKALLLATGDPSSRYLLRIPLTGQQPTALTAGSGASTFSISPTLNALVYAEYFQDHDIWRIPGPTASRTEAPQRLISSTRDDFMPEVSPNGKNLAYVSARSGTLEVWVATADGKREQRLTNLGHALFPRWSPDGGRIAFSSLPPRVYGAVSDVYVMDADRGLPEKITNDNHPDGIPAWSFDGTWIYFQSRADSLGWQLWRQPSRGGPSERVLKSPVLRAHIASNGTIVFYVPRRGVWVKDADRPRAIVNDVAFWTEWTLWKNLVIYVKHADSGSTIESLDILTGEARQIAIIPPTLRRSARLPGSTIAAAPDGSWIAYTALERNGSDLRIVAGIR